MPPTVRVGTMHSKQSSNGASVAPFGVQQRQKAREPSSWRSHSVGSTTSILDCSEGDDDDDTDCNDEDSSLASDEENRARA